MIFKDAMRSLREDPSRTFFYFLTFFVTSLFMFLFFNMAVSEMAVNADYVFTGGMADVSTYMEQGDIANIMSVYVVIMCCVDILFANHYFIINKAPDLAVRLVCGATFTQLVGFLLSQTVVLMGIAIPLGVAAGCALLPLLNHILAASAGNFSVAISSSAVIQFLAIMAMMVFWTTMLNISYVYLNEAAQVLNGQGTVTDVKGSATGSVFSKVPVWLRAAAGLVLTALPLVLFFTDSTSEALLAVIGLFGLDIALKNFFIPLLTRRIKKHDVSHPVKAAMLGFLRTDLAECRITIYLFLGSCELLAAMLVMRMDNPIAVMMVTITYVVMAFMQAMTIMFRLQTELSDRPSAYHVLEQVGFERRQEKRILHLEMRTFFLIVLGVSLVYSGCMFFSLVMKGKLTMHFALALLAVMAVSVILAWLISDVYYAKNAFRYTGEGQ